MGKTFFKYDRVSQLHQGSLQHHCESLSFGRLNVPVFRKAPIVALLIAGSISSSALPSWTMVDFHRIKYVAGCHKLNCKIFEVSIEISWYHKNCQRDVETVSIVRGLR